MTVTIMLFILSMISERIVTFFKLWCVNGKRFLFGIVPKDVDTSIKSDNPETEARRTKGILAINLTISFLIALTAKATLFDMFTNSNPSEPKYLLGWNFPIDLYFPRSGSIVLGCMLTGAFISLGSKFWHDILDLLLQVKNLKSKLVDKATHEVESIKQFDEHISLSDSNIAAIAISQNENLLKNKYKNISFLTDSISLVNNKRKSVIGIHIDDSKYEDIPTQVPARLPSNRVVMVTTEVITNSGMGKITAGSDSGVANESSPNYCGSLCCLVTDESGIQYLVTNCHVMSEGELIDPDFDVNDENALCDEQKIGKWYYGSMDNKGDFALINLNKPEEFSNQHNWEPFVGMRELTKSDLNLKVKANGNKSGEISGFVSEIVEKKIGITYKYGKALVFDKVILVGSSLDKDACQPITNFGDSGGSLYDETNNLIGIITGKNDRFTFVIPLNPFLSALKLSLPS